MNLAERISRLERILLVVAQHIEASTTTYAELTRAVEELSEAVKQPEFKGYASREG